MTMDGLGYTREAIAIKVITKNNCTREMLTQGIMDTSTAGLLVTHDLQFFWRI